MEIAIWGVIDKCCRLELGLWAVPNARLADVPPALYLRLTRKIGGMCVQTASDKGTELSKLIALITTLRQVYRPYLSKETLPAHKAVKIVYNITLNVIGAQFGRKSSEMWPLNTLKFMKRESHAQSVNKPEASFLRDVDSSTCTYEHPEDFDGLENQLIEIPREDIDKILDEYDQPDLLQFGSDEMVQFCERLFEKIGAPQINAKVGWKVFRQMLECAAAAEDT
ncbi:hypothetical protein BJ912DRAFT_1130611 [Pholiota molesta]|nr:hypothetical protein BJ912DRAFT_1130611 [Pholiota molesta]